MSAAPALELALQRAYSGFTLDVSIKCGPGITAIFGPSGSGKTTTLNCVAGLARPTRGRIALGGRVLFSSEEGINLSPERRRIGYVFQDGALFPHLTGRENILYGYRITPPSERRFDPGDLIQLLGIGHVVDRRPGSLSGGEQRRVGIARALATSPNLLLLDEPLAGLDLRMGGVVMSHLRRVRAELGIPMLYVSHDVTSVLALADDAIVLAGGRVTAQGKPSKVALEAVAGMRSEGGVLENVLEGTVADSGGDNRPGRVTVGNAEFVTAPLDATPGSAVSVYVGAAEIILARERPVRMSARNILPGRILEVWSVDGSAYVTVDIGTHVISEVTAAAVGELGLAAGVDVFMVFKSTSIGVVES